MFTHKKSIFFSIAYLFSLHTYSMNNNPYQHISPLALEYTLLNDIIIPKPDQSNNQNNNHIEEVKKTILSSNPLKKEVEKIIQKPRLRRPAARESDRKTQLIKQYEREQIISEQEDEDHKIISKRYKGTIYF